MARTTIPAELVAINAIQGTLIADNAITAVHIATNAVSGTLVADNAITSTHIAQNNVTATQIAQNTITVTQMADSAIETAKINNDAVTQAKIADDAVGPDQLAANAVVTGSIANGSIIEADMADNAVTLAKMASLARGSVIVGDSAGDPSALAIGSNTYVLSSDGTDVSWAAASGGVDGISSSADATAITIGADESVDFAKGVVVLGSGTTAGVYLNGTNSDTATQGNFVRYGTNFATQSNANNSLLITKAFNGSTFLDAFTVKSDGSVGIGTTTTFSNPLTLNKAAGAANSLNNQIALTHTGASTAYHIKTIRAAGTDEPAGLAFVENTTERMRIDSTGKVGIGATTIDEKLHIEVSSGDAAIKLEDASGDYIRIDQNSVGANDKIRFKSGSSLTERARITSTGDFLSNTTTAVSSFYNGASGLGFGYSAGGYGAVVRTATNTPLYISTTGSGNTRFIEFYNGTTVRGGINWNGSTLSAVTGSDYRLKENIAPIQNALTRINTLNPVSYDMIDTGVSGEGFLAHEAQTVIPYAVIGTKDEVYEADNVPEEKEDQIGQPKYQMMDYAKLTPLLVKAVQEQQTIIDDLKSRIETLEG